MLRPSIFLKAMRDQRWMIFGFGAGGALMAALILGIYPSYKPGLEGFEMPKAFEAIIGDLDIATGPGFVTAEFFSWIPVLLVVYAIIQGTGALAGEESSGTLDLLLAQPVSRTRLFIEKAVAIIVGTLAIVALMLPGWFIPYGAVDIGVGLDRLVIATVSMTPLTLAFAALSLLAGAVLPTRRDAASALTVLAIVSFFINGLGQVSELIEPLRPVSLFYYFHANEVVLAGVDGLGTVVLLGVALASGSLAALAFQRRDLGVVLGKGLVERLVGLLPVARPESVPEDAG